jgi:hypothetical protein
MAVAGNKVFFVYKTRKSNIFIVEKVQRFLRTTDYQKQTFLDLDALISEWWNILCISSYNKVVISLSASPFPASHI